MEITVKDYASADNLDIPGMINRAAEERAAREHTKTLDDAQRERDAMYKEWFNAQMVKSFNVENERKKARMLEDVEREQKAAKEKVEREYAEKSHLLLEESETGKAFLKLSKMLR